MKYITKAGVMLGGVALLIGGATACEGDADTSSTTDTSTGVPAGLSKRDLSEASFNITWGSSTPTEQAQLCAGLIILGPERAAEEMQSGADGSTDADWDYMVELLAKECGE